VTRKEGHGEEELDSGDYLVAPWDAEVGCVVVVGVLAADEGAAVLEAGNLGLYRNYNATFAVLKDGEDSLDIIMNSHVNSPLLSSLLQSDFVSMMVPARGRRLRPELTRYQRDR
jgi:hypothetical protein